MKKLNRKFYCRNTVIVAKALLGKLLVHKVDNKKIAGRIVETEAYFGKGDPASHASRGVTPRNKVMFEKPGYAYVYFCYGFYNMFNVVTEKEGVPGAVLIRALEPVKGVDFMRKMRKTNDSFNLTNGPGKLTLALKIDLTKNKEDLTGNKLFIADDGKKKYFKIVSSKRIGINVAKDKLLRFYIKGNPFVSKMAKG